MITLGGEVPRIETDIGIRCTRCNKSLAEKATRPWRIMCPRCKHVNMQVRITPAEELPPKPAPLPKQTRKRRRKKTVDNRASASRLS